MNIPLKCPCCSGAQMMLELVDHQHITCTSCGCEFCFQCAIMLHEDSFGDLHRSIQDYRRREYSAMVN